MRRSHMRRSVFGSAFILLLAGLLSGCLTGGDKGGPGEPSTGGVEAFIRLEQVGSLSKFSVIEMQRLVMTFTTSGEDTLRDTVPISGNAAQAVVKTVNGLARGKSWTMTVAAADAKGFVIYSGSQSFTMPATGTASASLTLAAQYSMLSASFFPIYDSVTRVELQVDGIKVADSSFAKQSKLGDTVKLGYDYLSASLAGTSHAIRLSVYGLKAGGNTTLLYRGDTTITVVSGQNANYNINLYWVDSSSLTKGPATITVGLGTMGTVAAYGKLEEGFESFKWGRVTRIGLENATGYPTNLNDRANGLAISSTGQPYVAMNTTGGYTGIYRLVGSKWQAVGPTTSLWTTPFLLVSQTDTPYVLYYQGGIRAARFNGTQWDTLGSPIAFSLGSFWSAALSNSGALHVINTNRLFRWSGAQWDTLAQHGNIGLSPSAFAISKTNVPHMVSAGPGSLNRLYRLSGTTWDSVGVGNFGAGSVRELAFSATNQVYMVQDVSGGGLRVMRWTGSTYSQVGGVISDSSLSSVSLSIHGETPYLAFRRTGAAPVGSSHYLQASVMKFNGSSWEYVGGLGFTSAFSPGGNGISTLTLAVAPNGTPWLAYHASGAGGGPVVLRYNLP